MLKNKTAARTVMIDAVVLTTPLAGLIGPEKIVGVSVGLAVGLSDGLIGLLVGFPVITGDIVGDPKMIGDIVGEYVLPLGLFATGDVVGLGVVFRLLRRLLRRFGGIVGGVGLLVNLVGHGVGPLSPIHPCATVRITNNNNMQYFIMLCV